MTVYVDDMRVEAEVPNGSHVVRGRWSHLMADTDEELHAFASRLGLRRAWAQHPGTWKSHYDVTDAKRSEALRLGAVALRYLHDTPQLTRCKRAGLPYPGPERDAEADVEQDRLF